MPSSHVLFRPRKRGASILPVAIFFAAACNDGASQGMADGGGRDFAAASPDLRTNNPPNPLGRGPAPVDIGSPTNLAAAGSYVVLAKTGITNVTGSAISGGHLGLSPAAASFITGFALMVDTTNMFATSAAVVSPRKIYASNYAAPTPSNLTTAVLGMQAAYRDAAGRTNPDFLNLDGGQLGGKTLTPGLYTWGSGINIAADVTIAGGSNDVWIFQTSNDLDLSSSKKVVVSGGAQAQNIFWQVAGQVTIHANAHFEGIILSQTAITLQTTATLHGRALAQSLVAIDNSTITAP